MCIGDRCRIGEAEFEVTQPRVTCYRVRTRLHEPRMASLLVAHHRPGFYLRVITEGRVRAGAQIARTRTGKGLLTVADTDALLCLSGPDPAKLRTALSIEALSPGWQQSFQDMGRRLDEPPRPSPAAPGWRDFRRLHVTQVVPESPTVSSFYLQAMDSQPLPPAMPGQYLSVRVPRAGQPSLVRSYSLSSAPVPPSTDQRQTRRPRRGQHLPPHPPEQWRRHRSDRLPRDVRVGRGSHARGTVLGGYRRHPVLAMLHQPARERSSCAVWRVHTARNPGQRAFAEEARRLLARLPNAAPSSTTAPRILRPPGGRASRTDM